MRDSRFTPRQIPDITGQIGRVWSRLAEKPLTFAVLGSLMTVTLTAAAVAAAPSSLLGPENPVNGIHPLIRTAVAFGLLLLSVVPMTALAFASAYRMRSFKALRYGLAKSGRVLRTMIAAMFVMLVPILLILPGLAMKARFSLMLPVIVTENRSGLEALRRSSWLVRGNTRKVFWNMLLIGFAGAVATAATAVTGITLAHLAEVDPSVSMGMLAAYRTGSIALPIAVATILFLPMLFLHLQVSYEDASRKDGPAAPARPVGTLTLYKVLAVAGVLLTTGAGATAIAFHPEFTEDRGGSMATVNGPVKRGPGDRHLESEIPPDKPAKPQEETAGDRDWRRYQDVAKIRVALRQYHDDNGDYPVDTDGLIPLYLETVPSDPIGDHPYIYRRTGDSFSITFALEEGIRELEGGTHVITPDGFDPATRRTVRPVDTENAADRDRKRYGDVATLRAALQRYHNDSGDYPAWLSGLAPSYLESVPIDPGDFTPYGYRQSNGSFTISFTLEQGIRGLSAGPHTLSPDGFDFRQARSSNVQNPQTAADRDRMRYQDVSALRAALQRYQNETGDYPAGIDGLVPDYLPEVPADPADLTPYAYEKAGGGFRITFFLEQGHDGLAAGRHTAHPNGIE